MPAAIFWHNLINAQPSASIWDAEGVFIEEFIALS